MTDYLITHTAEARLVFFVSIFVLMLALESVMYFRKSPTLLSRIQHLGHNFFLSLINTFILRIIFPTGLVSFALFSEKQAIGIFNYTSFNFLGELLLSVVLLDFFIYWQHRLMHTIPLLWKLHGVHHSEQFMDVSTGFRFHPLEMLFSFAIKIALVVLLGISPLAIIVFEIILSSFALFSHSNLKFPKKIENLLHSLLVTPAMHRVHHSIYLHESNMNFSFSVNCWDRLFGTFKKPENNQKDLRFGREKNHKIIESQNLVSMLSEPFKKSP